MATSIKRLDVNNIKHAPLPLVIGYFGSIHVVHAELLNMYHRFNVLTFEDTSKKSSSQIYAFSDRIKNIATFKPQNIFIFNIAKSNMTARQFIDRVLLKMQPSSIVVGSDFKFGSDHKPVDILRANFKVETINYNPSVSSTIIASLLKDGDVERANGLAYFPYYYISKWVHGVKRGRRIGARTINMIIDHKICVPEGSYVTRITIGSKSYKAISFFGKSKTYASIIPVLETHVIDKTIPPMFLFSKRIRDNVKVEFLKYIRPNIKFNKDSDNLIKAIRKDIDVANDYFEHNK